MAIKLTNVPSAWDVVYRRLLFGSDDQKGVTEGRFYDLRVVIVPFSRKNTYFKLEVDEEHLNIPFKFTVVREDIQDGIDGKKDEKTFTFVPRNLVSTIGILLGKGLNSITINNIVNKNESPFTFNVTATYLGTFLNAYAKDIYIGVESVLERLRTSIFNDDATRLAEPLVSYFPVLSDIKSIQAFQLQTSIKALVNNPGSEDALNAFIKALVQSTALIKKIEDDFNFDPSIYNIHSTQENYGGYDVHAWLNNEQVNKWISFARIIDNFGRNIKRLNKDEIVFDDNGKLRVHRFTFESDGGNVGRDEGPAKIEAWISNIEIVHNFDMDAFIQILPIPITADSPLADRDQDIYTDQENPFDQGNVLDAGTISDPFDDGFVGESIVDYIDNPDRSVPGTKVLSKISTSVSSSYATVGSYPGTITSH